MTNNSTGQQPTQLLAKHQPCGCIVCTCADDARCHGCGAWHCGTHPVSEIPNAVYEQPAQPSSGELAKPVQRYHIRHLIDGDNVLDWPRDLRKGPDVVLASDYDRLQSALTAERDQLAAENARLKEHLERVIGGHSAPGDCYSTGPLTGDPVKDLVACPSCAALDFLASRSPAKKGNERE